jgi:hypothetical protein
MEEVAKALGPWPILQTVFGTLILLLGVWSIIRGIRGKDYADDRRAEWEAYNQLENIEQNTFKIVESNQKIAEALDRLASIMWNREKL